MKAARQAFSWRNWVQPAAWAPFLSEYLATVGALVLADWFYRGIVRSEGFATHPPAALLPYLSGALVTLPFSVAGLRRPFAACAWTAVLRTGALVVLARMARWFFDFKVRLPAGMVLAFAFWQVPLLFLCRDGVSHLLKRVAQAPGSTNLFESVAAGSALVFRELAESLPGARAAVSAARKIAQTLSCWAAWISPRVARAALPALFICGAALLWAQSREIVSSHLGLRMIAALLCGVLIPGAAVLRASGFGRERDWLEFIPLAFGIGLIGVAAASVAGLLGHWNMGQVAAASLFVGGGSAVYLAAAGWPQPSRRGESDSLFLRLALIVFLVYLGILLYRIGGVLTPGLGPDLEEEGLQVSIIRKLAFNPALAVDNIMYKPGTISSYVFAPYHFLLALLSRLSQIDPLLFFVKFRLIGGLIGFLSVYALLKTLFHRRAVATVGALALGVLVLNNAAGHVAGYYWAGIVPLAHLGDFGLGVLVPLMLVFCLKCLQSRPGEEGFKVFAPLILIAGILVHSRDAVQVLVYLAAFIGGCWLLRVPNRVPARRAAFLIAAAVLFGWIFKFWHGGLVGHIRAYEAANQWRMWKTFQELLSKPFWGLSASVPKEMYALMHLPYLYLAGFALPFLIGLRKRLWAVVIISSVAAFLWIIRSPHLSYAFILSTYSEMMTTPPRFVFHWSFVVFAALIFVILQGLLRVWRTGRIRAPFLAVAAFGIGLGLGALLNALPVLSRRDPNYMYGWALGALVLFAVGARLFPGASRWFRFQDPMRAPVSPAWLSGLLLAALLFPIYHQGHWGPTLKKELAEARRAPSVGKWRVWYARAGFEERLPLEVVEFIRTEIPGPAVFAAPYERANVIPIMANHYVISWGGIFSSELDFVDAYLQAAGERMDFSGDPFAAYAKKTEFCQKLFRERRPLFNPKDSPEASLRFADAYRVNYVLADPATGPLWRSIAARYPARLRQLYDRGGYVIYQVAQHAP